MNQANHHLYYLFAQINNFHPLTIYQNSPIKGISKISATILMTTDKCSITKLIDSIEKIPSVKEVKYKTIEKD